MAHKSDTYNCERNYVFLGLGKGLVLAYPRWMYRQDTQPILIKNTEAEAEAREKGFDNISASALSNRDLINFFWDFEDFSIRQLLVYAKDEFDIDLPAEASQQTLFKAVCSLTRSAPQNRNRLVLMAHTIEMNYDATLEEIKRMANDTSEYLERQTETEEFWA
jgi:hypothetical protein